MKAAGRVFLLLTFFFKASEYGTEKTKLLKFQRGKLTVNGSSISRFEVPNLTLEPYFFHRRKR